MIGAEPENDGNDPAMATPAMTNNEPGSKPRKESAA